MIPLPFRDRSEAGRKLTEKLRSFAGRDDVIVLALVRGGVAVGRPIADALRVPLHPYVVRKIGHPAHREFGVGAIAEGGATYLDESAMRLYGLAWEDIETIIEEEMSELKRRREACRVTPLPLLTGKTVILVDDGAATGSTLFAAIRDMRKAKAQHIVVALPVCPTDTLSLLTKKSDRAIVLETPEEFDAVGKWYREFPQLTDGDVTDLLLQHPEKT